MVARLQFQDKPNINFGYAYDMTLSKFSGTHWGSHELMVRFEPHEKKGLAKRTKFNQKTSYYKAKKSESQFTKASVEELVAFRDSLIVSRVPEGPLDPFLNFLCDARRLYIRIKKFLAVVLPQNDIVDKLNIV